MKAEGLKGIFGAKFVSEYKKVEAERMSEKMRLTADERKDLIKKLKDMDPNECNIEYKGCDVMLFQVPNREMEPKELESGAVSVLMFSAGNAVSVLFNNKADLEKVHQGEYYLLIGKYSEKQGDKGVFKNFRFYDFVVEEVGGKEDDGAGADEKDF